MQAGSQRPFDDHYPPHQGPAGAGSSTPQDMTSTITLLPASPLDLSRGPFNAALAPTGTTNIFGKRPKLSLNTACPQRQTLGKGNTGLRLDTLSACSPTIHNTFKNSYDPPAAMPNIPGLTGSQPPSASPSARSPRILHASPSPSAAPRSPFKAPYVLGKHPRSILTNGPHAKRARSQDRRVSKSLSMPHIRSSPSRRVGFHHRLSEDIHNKDYVAQHYDLLIASPSPIVNTHTRTHQNRQSPRDEDVIEDSSEDGEAYPKTPVAGRKKRQQDWVWTLGPIDGVPRINSQRDQEPP